MLKLKRKRRGVGIWSENLECFSVRESFVQIKSDRETLFTERGYGIDSEREFAETDFQRI